MNSKPKQNAHLERVSDMLMRHGVLKNRDAMNLAKGIESVFQVPNEPKINNMKSKRTKTEAQSSLAQASGSVICCDICGERIRGHSYLKDGMILCGLCLDDEQNRILMTSEQQKLVDSKLYTRQTEGEPPVRVQRVVSTPSAPLIGSTLPCPWCGSDRIMAEGTLSRMAMVCQTCLARGPEVLVWLGRAAALKAWNKRP
jgi:hypothetical protein